MEGKTNGPVYQNAAAATNAYGEGGGPRSAQRFIFGYTGRTDYTDSKRNQWRPATEFVIRTGKATDSVAKSWWTMKQALAIENTPDEELYKYGVHGMEFAVYFTVGPGLYDVQLKFSETQYAAANRRRMAIYINGEEKARDLDIFARAGGQQSF